ncbi:hypothetical protein M948_18320 [Virgibacillus sp. CM-4]|uniref:hypothetical protein n=1 Tax=Virgibacillus sp. CM-4 TaxID=1354277 RepID=UPI0003889C42|nr:hypothetical protein [Virgibacillus sp. CM-4]EQB35055.1 hypothetical protein M948_18320 [Virgibacillus sp. CM-4]
MNEHKTTSVQYDLSRIQPNKKKLQQDKKEKPPIIPKEQLDRIKIGQKQDIVFSWRFFDRYNKLFSMGNSKREWFIGLIDCLSNVSKMKVMEFRQQSKKRGLRVHSHNWKNATDKYNFTDEWFDQHSDDCLQFSISKANGRVHGFLIDNVFYIIWLDPEHNLYPPKESNRKVLEYDYPVTEYEILEHDYHTLELQFKELQNELKACEILLEEHA